MSRRLFISALLVFLILALFSITNTPAARAGGNTINIDDVTWNEGNVGTTVFEFTVSLDSFAPAGGVTFDIATADGTAEDDNPATEDNDYVANSLTGQTIPQFSQTYSFSVLVNGDLVNETDETFFVNISNVSGASLGDIQGQGTIVNDDCLAGTYFDGNSCVPAPPGYYVDVAGAIAPNACLPGSYQPNSGQTSCLFADPGFFVPASALISQTPCPSGSNSAAAAVVCFQTGPNFVVNDATDTDDTACDALPGDCTLREAINAANALAGADTITFDIPDDAGALCSANNVCTITLSALGSLPAINGNVTIDGSANLADITVNGADTYRVLMVNSGIVFNLNSLTITHGTTIANGGGLYNEGGTVTVTKSTFSFNSATSGSGLGGAIYNLGTLNIFDSTFHNNSSPLYGGGAIYNSVTSILTVTNSSFVDNSTGGSGGAIENNNIATITNSTFNNNSTAGSADIFNTFTLTLKNSIIVNSIGGEDCGNSGTLTADTFNIDSDGTCDNATQKTTAQIDLQGIANNGGPTQTMALGNASAAINTGNNTVCAAAVGSPNFGAGGFDQRGTVRPQGLFCDVGAYELVYTGLQPGPNFVVNSAADTNDNSCDVLGQGIGNKDCTLREAINAANALAGADTITFNIPDTGPECSSNNVCTITLSALGTLPAINDTVTIDGAPNTGKITVNGANSYGVLQVDNSKTLNLNALTIEKGKAVGGGGILNTGGTLNVTNSTFSANSTTVGEGGGIYSNGGTVNVTNSTFDANTSNANGGGIFNTGSTLNVTNSTFSGNTASVSGGGIYTYGGTVRVINSTFSGNGALFGGGLHSDGGITLYNTIVTNSTGGDDCDTNVGILIADSSNIASDASCDNATQKTVAEIDLQGIANNGGPTETMALGNSSVAIDAGDDTVCDDNPGPNNFDQRGEARNDLQCDVGAFEFVQSDGDTVFKSFATDSSSFTFGPTLADMLLNSGSPLTLAVKRELLAPNPAPNLPAGALPNTWDASTKESQFSLRVTLCYDPVTYPIDPTTLHVWHYNNITMLWDDLGGTSDTSHAPYACVKANQNLTALSPLALAPGGTTAVNVTGVKGAVNVKGNIVIKWRTTSESQIAGFNVYRRTRKGEWKQINAQFMQAKHAGSVEGAKYRFADKRVKKGKTYRYKIEALYLDNHSEYTQVIQVKR